MRLCNLFTQTGNIGFDVQLHVIISQAVRENLLEHICAVQRRLTGSGDVIIDADREGDTQSSQLFYGLFFVLLCFFFVQTNHSLTVWFWQPHFLPYQFGIVSTIRSIDQSFHGVEIVLTNHRIYCVGSLVVLLQIKTVPPRQAKGFVRYCRVPIDIRCTIFKKFVVIQLELIAIFGRYIRNHVIMEFILWVFGNSVNLRLTQ